LKQSQTPLSEFIGNLYFNVLNFGCLTEAEQEEDDSHENEFTGRSSRSTSPGPSFSPLRMPQLHVSYRNMTF
jgi:hypothetical protein